jgi:hypothetical protein
MAIVEAVAALASRFPDARLEDGGAAWGGDAATRRLQALRVETGAAVEAV